MQVRAVILLFWVIYSVYLNDCILHLKVITLFIAITNLNTLICLYTVKIRVYMFSGRKRAQWCTKYEEIVLLLYEDYLILVY